jgi:type III secretion protein R
MLGQDPLLLILSLGLIGIAPFLAVMVTSYAKLVVVFSLVRNALGLQQVPPNMVVNGLALVLSLYIMAPLAQQLTAAMDAPARGAAGAASNAIKSEALIAGLSASREPLRAFLSKHTQKREKEFFVRTSKSLWPPEQAAAVKADDLLILVPAFTVTELTAAFKIGFLLYLGFVIIDLVVANVLSALGMMMFSPTVVSTPLKLMLFVVADGWAKLIHGLVLTYQ